MKWFTLIEWHLYVLFLYFFSSFFKTVIELENTSHFVAFYFSLFIIITFLFIFFSFHFLSLSLSFSFSFLLLFLLLFFASSLSFLFLSSDNLFIFPFFLFFFFYQSFLPCRISLIASIDILIIDVEEHIIQIFHM